MIKKDQNSKNLNIQLSSHALIGRCGLYCGACGIYRTFIDKRVAKLQQMAKFFKCRPDQVRCQGCQNLTPEDWCSGCKILECLEKKSYRYCYQCMEIETCEIFQELNRRYNNLPYENLKQLKELGEEKWLKKNVKKWSCPKCGTPFEYEAKKCPRCGHKLTG
jgi:hypothetical protein